jgi:hypothetical protein
VWRNPHMSPPLGSWRFGIALLMEVMRLVESKCARLPVHRSVCLATWLVSQSPMGAGLDADAATRVGRLAQGFPRLDADPLCADPLPTPPLVWGWREAGARVRPATRDETVPLGAAGRRYVATGTAAAAVSIIVTTSSGCETIAT